MSRFPPKPTAIDGATLRLYRMMVLAKSLKDGQIGAPLERIEGFMSTNFGMRRRTTDELVKDMENARILIIKGVNFMLSPFGEKWLADLAKKEGL